MAKKPKSSKKSMSLSNFFDRFHAVIFTLVVGLSLSVAIFSINTVINSTEAPEGYVPSSTDTNFDEITINKIKEMRPQGEPVKPLELPQTVRTYRLAE